MSIHTPQPQDNAGLIVIVIIVAVLCVRYWRIAIPMIIAAALALTILGLVEGLNFLYHA